MDLVNTKTVIAMMYHLNRDGVSKLVRKCTLPLTGKNVVHYVVTDFGVFKPNLKKNSFEILKLSDGADKDFLQDNLFSEIYGGPCNKALLLASCHNTSHPDLINLL